MSDKVFKEPVSRERSEALISARNANRKNVKKSRDLEKKNTVTVAGMIENVEQKSGDDVANLTTANDDTNDFERNKNLNAKSRKRKNISEGKSLSRTEQEKNVADMNFNSHATNSGKNENISAKKTRDETARSGNFENITDQETGAISSTVNKVIGNEKGNKTGSKKYSTAKATAHPPISEMVLTAFRNLKKRNGTSAEEISKYVQENYLVNINRIKPYIKKFLQKGVTNRLLDRVSGSGVDGKFKIKKTEKNYKKAGKTTRVGKEARKDQKVARETKKNSGKVKKYAKEVKKATGKFKDLSRKVKKGTGKFEKRVEKVTKEIGKIKNGEKTKRDKIDNKIDIMPSYVK